MARGRHPPKDPRRRIGGTGALHAPADEAPLDPLDVESPAADAAGDGGPARAALAALEDVEDALAHGRRALGPGAPYRSKLLQLGEAVVRSGWKDAPQEVKALLAETEQLRSAATAARDAALPAAKDDPAGAGNQVFTDRIP